MNSVPIDDIQRIAGLSISTLMKINTSHTDGEFFNEQEIVTWMNSSFLIVSGSAIFDSMVEKQLLSIHVDGTIDITEKGCELINSVLLLYTLKD